MRPPASSSGPTPRAIPHLDRLSAGAVAEEMRLSRVAVEEWTGRPCRVFAYPYGHHNAETVEAARSEFDRSVIVGGGWWTEPGDLARIPRIGDPRGHEFLDSAVHSVSRPRRGPAMKRVLKAAVFAIAVVLASPLIALAWLEELIFGDGCERIFDSFKELLAIIPTPIGEYLRQGFYWGSC